MLASLRLLKTSHTHALLILVKSFKSTESRLKIFLTTTGLSGKVIGSNPTGGNFLGNFYRPQRSREGYVFTRVCLSTGGVLVPGGCLVLGGVWSRRVCSRGRGLVSKHALRQTPPPRERRLLLRTVRILLECILVCANKTSDVSVANI